MSLVLDGATQSIQGTAIGDHTVPPLSADNLLQALSLQCVARLFGEIIQLRPDFDVVNRLFPAFRRDFG